MEKYSYYAVLGRNGVAVADSWPAACAMRQYLRNTSTVGFHEFHEAEDYALQVFADRFPNSSYSVTYLTVNRPVFAARFRGRYCE